MSNKHTAGDYQASNYQASDYQKPMLAYPSLDGYGRKVRLPKSGLEVFFYDAGSPDRPAALLVHGLGDEADTWRHLLKPLSHTWRVIAPDLPGFGRSEEAHGECSEGFFIQVLLELLEVLGIHKSLLVGHSLGAALVHRIALDNPQRAQGLILLDGSLILKPRGLNPQVLLFIIPGIGEWLYSRLRKDPQAAFESLEAYYGDLASLPNGDCDFLYQRVNQRVWSDKQRKAYLSTLRSYAVKAAGSPSGLKEKLAALEVPTLVLWGEQDRVYSPDSGLELAELQPGVRLVMIPGAGHNAHQEKPAMILEEILRDGRFFTD